MASSSSNSTPASSPTTSATDNDDCSICLCPLAGKVSAVQACRHRFHAECLVAHIKTDNSRKRTGFCPLCRGPANLGKLKKYDNYINRFPPADETPAQKRKRLIRRKKNEKRNQRRQRARGNDQSSSTTTNQPENNSAATENNTATTVQPGNQTQGTPTNVHSGTQTQRIPTIQL